MTTILVQGTTIVAVDPVDAGSSWLTVDQVIPKQSVSGAFEATVTLPDDYTPGRYIYDGSNIIAKAPDPTVLKAYKDAKNLEINTDRLAVNRSSFTYAGKLISCDELSRSDIDAMQGAVQILGGLPPNWVGGWKAMDNSVAPITTLADWHTFYMAMVVQGQTNFAKSQALKASLAAATTIEQVQAINWS